MRSTNGAISTRGISAYRVSSSDTISLNQHQIRKRITVMGQPDNMARFVVLDVWAAGYFSRLSGW